jgi:hypothetical protein
MFRVFQAAESTLPFQRVGLGLLAAAALSCLHGNASAQTTVPQRGHVYAGLGLTEVSDVVDFGAVTGRLGARFTPYLAVEGEASVGVLGPEVEGRIEADGRSTPFALSAALDYALAGYLVGIYPAASNFDLFARAGLGRARVDVEGSAGGSTIEGSGEGEFYALGLGGQYSFDGNNGVRLEYTRLRLEGLGYDVGTFGLSYVRRF